MIFNSAVYYLLFLAPAVILFRLVPSRFRPWVCILSGGLFFIYFSLTQLGEYLGAACLAIFIWEGLFRNLYSPGSRWCMVGIGVSLIVLGVFKYWNFASGLLHPFVGQCLPIWHDAFLPLGISFFTFEFIHYASDRYLDKTEKGTFAEYLAFIFFFPTMVAGPIKRFQDFIPCLRNPSTDWPIDIHRGLTRILVGLVKKFAIADLLTSLTDHLNMQDIALAERWVLPVWLFAYGWKIYFDFSAYSDIAIGSGRLFGIRIPENFDWPYFRTNIADFWRHWHMSLYSWLVDYVFIPLGGSRGSQLFVCRNVMIVMLVSGLWHGAGMNFLVWGGWHGLLLVVHRIWGQCRGLRERTSSLPGYSFCAWGLTYLAVNLGWAFFAMDLPTATYFFKRILLG